MKGALTGSEMAFHTCIMRPFYARARLVHYHSPTTHAWISRVSGPKPVRRDVEQSGRIDHWSWSYWVIHIPGCAGLLLIAFVCASLTAALWMSQLGIQTRVIDKRGTRVLNGHADGIQTRTLEILNSFGLARRFIERSASFLEWCVWVCCYVAVITLPLRSCKFQYAL